MSARMLGITVFGPAAFFLTTFSKLVVEDLRKRKQVCDSDSKAFFSIQPYELNNR